MGRIGAADIRRAWYYLRRNGFAAAFYAARERLAARGKEPYAYRELPRAVLEEQRSRKWEEEPLFSIVVPAYRTDRRQLCAMIESVLSQTYSRWELLVADASPEEDGLGEIVRAYPDERIRYFLLPENRGIAENTNEAVKKAAGAYIGLLDHDDLLTPDALYEMADRILQGKRDGVPKRLLYSDEDKIKGEVCFDPHRKEDFNLDLLLSNHYICHFMVMESDLLKDLPLRREYDGAQDYDLVLRAAGRILDLRGGAEPASRLSTEPASRLSMEAEIAHIPKVLYHWRCHAGSTAQNPQSKWYAYEAGRRAVQDFARSCGWAAEAVHLKHAGFYRLRYQPDIFSNRPDIGAVGGVLLVNGKISGGIYQEDGTNPYEGLRRQDSGYMHKAALFQDAYAVDLRLLRLRNECRPLWEAVTGRPCGSLAGEAGSDTRSRREASLAQPDEIGLSLKLGKALREAGYRVAWDPDWKEDRKRNWHGKSNRSNS
ncbi:MAG: glycosyltransferase [Clostridium sp.]|jgi:glycosyltransferase involved in cell wall biosynthesis|nr:glycosyltransferase [Clostridium sp.]